MTNRGSDTNANLGHVGPHSVTELACAKCGVTHADFSHKPLWMIFPVFWGWMSLHRQKRLDERKSMDRRGEGVVVEDMPQASPVVPCPCRKTTEDRTTSLPVAERQIKAERSVLDSTPPWRCVSGSEASFLGSSFGIGLKTLRL